MVGVTRTVGIVVLVGILGLGLAGCGRQNAPGSPPGGTAPAVDATDLDSLAEESQALLALGFDRADLDGVMAAASASPDPDAGPGPGKGDKGGRGRGHGAERGQLMRLRAAFGKDALHGEVTVQTRKGPKTLVAQRGEITARTDKTITVKSADGYTLTWTFADRYRFFQHRRPIAPTELKVGMRVGVAGVKAGDTPMARAIIIPKR